jgi:ribosomal protein S8E
MAGVATGLSAGAIAAIGGTLISGLGALFGGGAKRREAYYARLRRDELTKELNILENKRQTITNPYAGVKDLSSMAKDLSSMVSNPYANLGVATKAADIQIEQTDIALANTLDTLRATGASAGGATALAQAALQSKKGVAANLEQQEAQNDKLRAQGESKLEMLKMQEAQRLQTIGMSEAQRIQQAGVAGEQFMFSTRERRETEQLNRKQAQITNAAQTAVAASQGADAIYSAGLSSFGQIASSVAGNEKFKWKA